MRRALDIALLIAAIGATAAFTSGGHVFRGPAPAAPSPGCGTRTAPPATYDHVIWIWMENHSYAQTIGSRRAPFANRLAAGCGLATNYRAVTHPSLPNYVAATSGGTRGIADDAPPAAHPLTTSSIFEQAPTAGSYEESMPSACRLTDASPYAVKHNPEAYYTRIRAACARTDRPLGSPARGPFHDALQSGRLPAFSLVTPNLCHDEHDCPVRAGDTWLRRWVTAIVASPAYRSGRTVLFITWDEDDTEHGNHVPALVVSPYTAPGTRSAAPFTHYSLLRTTEELLGLDPPGNAAAAASMRAPFGL